MCSYESELRFTQSFNFNPCCFYYEPMTQHAVDRIVTPGCGCYSPPHILKDSCMIKHNVTLRSHKHFTLHKRDLRSFSVYIKCCCHIHWCVVSGRNSLSSCWTPLKSATCSICVRLSEACHAGRNTGQLHLNSN